MKKIFVVYGHYDEKSFNAAIRDTFKETLENNGHQVDIVDLYKEKFDPVFSGEEPDNKILDHRKRIESSDAIVLIAPIWNFRMPAIVEGWIDKVLAPPWAFRFKRKKSCSFLYLWLPTIRCKNIFFKYANKKIKKRCFQYMRHNGCGISKILCSTIC